VNLPRHIKCISVLLLSVAPHFATANPSVDEFIENIGVVTYDCPDSQYEDQLDQYLLSDDISPQQRFQLITKKTHFQNCEGQSQKAQEALKALVADPSVDKDSKYYASAIYQIGFTYDTREMNERCEYYSDALKLSLGRFDDIELSSTLGLLVNKCDNSGYTDQSQVVAALFATIERYSQTDNKRALAHIHNSVGLFFGKQFQQVLAAEQFLKAYEMGSEVYTGSNRLTGLISAISALFGSGQYDRAKDAIEEFAKVNNEVNTPITNFWYYFAKSGYHYRVGEIEELEATLIPFGDIVRRINVKYYNDLYRWYSAVPCLERKDLDCLRSYVAEEGSLGVPQKVYASYEYYKFMMRSYLLLGDVEGAAEAFELIVRRLDTIRQNEERFTKTLGVANLYSQIFVLENKILVEERRRNLVVGAAILSLLIFALVVGFYVRKRHIARMSLDPVTQLLNSKTAIARISRVEKPSQDKTNALAIFDLGNFREVNRQVGSTKGDYVLQTIATTFSKVTRDRDILGRFAPEQFILCLTDIDEASAKSFFERVQEALQNTLLEGQHGATMSIRSSMSIYISNEDFSDLNTILDEIQRDPSQAEQLMKNAEYLRAELHYAARREMITKLEDFVRRRSKIEMVLRKQEIMDTPGMIEACEILFGDEADDKRKEYCESCIQS
jgi:diguanylate cyclase (GGDEF)-like protein